MERTNKSQIQWRKKAYKKLDKKNVKAAKSSNINKWGKDKKHNILFVTGLSGSGKSTVAEGLRNKDTNVIHLDFYTNVGNGTYAKGHRDKEFNEHLKREVPEFFDKYNGEFPALSKLSAEEKKEFWKTMDAFGDAIVSFGEKQYGRKKVIVEGVQIADETLFFDKNFFKDKPLMILSTDVDTSLQRAAERDEIEISDTEAMHIRKVMQDNWSKSIEKLENTTSAKLGEQYINHLLKGL